MGRDEELPRSEDDQVVQRGESYDHAEHGEVEVTGIWRGIHELDEARNTNEKDLIIVRYTAERNPGPRVEELIDTLPAFLEAID